MFRVGILCFVAFVLWCWSLGRFYEASVLLIGFVWSDDLRVIS